MHRISKVNVKGAQDCRKSVVDAFLKLLRAVYGAKIGAPAPKRQENIM